MARYSTKTSRASSLRVAVKTSRLLKHRQNTASSITYGFILIPILSLFASLAQASNECRIQYRYTTGSGFNKTEHARNVSLDAGQLRDVNQGNMVSIRSLPTSTKQIEVQLANKTFRLDKGNIDPPIGPYLTLTLLQQLRCINTTSAEPISNTVNNPDNYREQAEFFKASAKALEEKAETTVDFTKTVNDKVGDPIGKAKKASTQKK